MTDSGDLASAGVLFLHKVYAEELRVHAVTFIWLGYRRLDAASLALAEEDDITGELVREMKVVALNPSSPAWVDHYEIHEQVPQNVGGKRGKRRPKMDIEFERHDRGPRPRLCFEAKRLGRGATLGSYLGDEGLGAFLCGYYPTTHGEGGMLGYVQNTADKDWATKLGDELMQGHKKYRVVDGGELKMIDVIPEMPFFRSGHTDENGHAFLATHIILPFFVADVDKH